MPLISRSDIQAVVQFSDNLPQEKVDSAIELASELDLKPRLGASFYRALVVGVAASTAIYVTLMNGEDYTYNEDTITFPGLKKAIAWYAYARYLSNQDSISTVNGLVESSRDNANRLSDKSITRKISEARAAAEHYMDEAHKYLCEKDTTYTLYDGDRGNARRGKIKITSIG